MVIHLTCARFARENRLNQGADKPPRRLGYLLHKSPTHSLDLVGDSLVIRKIKAQKIVFSRREFDEATVSLEIRIVVKVFLARTFLWVTSFPSVRKM